MSYQTYSRHKTGERRVDSKSEKDCTGPPELEGNLTVPDITNKQWLKHDLGFFLLFTSLLVNIIVDHENEYFSVITIT